MVWRSFVSARAPRATRRRARRARASAPAQARRGPAPLRRGRAAGLASRFDQHVALQHLAALAAAERRRRGRSPFSVAILAAAEGEGGIAAVIGAAAPACRIAIPPWPEQLGRLDLGRDAAAAAASSEPSSAPIATVAPGSATISASDAGGRRVHFQRHLFGFQFDQRFVGLHRVAALLEPLADGRLGDRFAKGRNANFCAHAIAPLEGALLFARIRAKWRTPAPAAPWAQRALDGMG